MYIIYAIKFNCSRFNNQYNYIRQAQIPTKKIKEQANRILSQKTFHIFKDQESYLAKFVKHFNGKE